MSNENEALRKLPGSMNKLKPCPFCGGEPSIAKRKGESLWSRRIVVRTQVSCRECEIGTRYTEKWQEPEAIEAWNRRAALAASGGKEQG